MPARLDRYWLRISPVALLAGWVVFWFSDTIADPDLWGHVRFGQDIIRAGMIVTNDIYSYRTTGERWINHEWLSEVIFAGIFNLSGPPGLVFFKLLASMVLVGLCYVHLRSHTAGAYFPVFLLLVSSIPFRLGLGTIRPQIFTYVCFLLELLVLEKASRGGTRWLWLLPALFAVWTNLHGGVLAGVGLLFIWIVARIATLPRSGATRARWRLGLFVNLLLVGLVCGAALLLNPYGAELVWFLWRTGTVARPEISEWVPLRLLSAPGQIYLALLAIGVTGLVASRRPRAPDLIVIFIVTAALPLVANRHYPLFALALFVVAGEPIADVCNRWSRPGWARSWQSRLIASVSIVVALVMLGLSIPRWGCIRIEPFYFGFPARAVALLKQNEIRGNMAVPFDWGEYVLWHLGPAVKVSIDGRRETIYSDEAYEQSRHFEQGTGVWNALLKASNTDLVMAQNGSATANLMACSDGWIPFYQDTFCVVFVRADFPNLAQIAEKPSRLLPDNGNGLCFPAPGPL